MSNYKQTLDYLFNKLPMYQQKGSIAYKADIKRITEASNILNNPQKKFKSIQFPLDYKKNKSQFIIKNDFNKKTVKKQISYILKKVL